MLLRMIISREAPAVKHVGRHDNNEKLKVALELLELLTLHINPCPVCGVANCECCDARDECDADNGSSYHEPDCQLAEVLDYDRKIVTHIKCSRCGKRINGTCEDLGLTDEGTPGGWDSEESYETIHGKAYCMGCADKRENPTRAVASMIRRTAKVAQ